MSRNNKWAAWQSSSPSVVSVIQPSKELPTFEKVADIASVHEESSESLVEPKAEFKKIKKTKTEE